MGKKDWLGQMRDAIVGVGPLTSFRKGPFKMKGISPLKQKEPGGKDKEIKPYQFTWGPPKLKATSKSLKKSRIVAKGKQGSMKKKKNILQSFTDFLKSPKYNRPKKK